SRTEAASAPTAASSGAAMPSPWANSAPSRWLGPTSGLPWSVAACTAAEIACCALVVGLKESIPHFLLLEVRVSLEPTSGKLSLFRSSRTDLRSVTVRAAGNTLAHHRGVAATLTRWHARSPTRKIHLR